MMRYGLLVNQPIKVVSTFVVVLSSHPASSSIRSSWI